MTPPASEGYWAQVWPPRSPEGPALLEEKRAAGKALHMASFLTPSAQLTGPCTVCFPRGAANMQNILFPKLIRCKSCFLVLVSGTAVLAQNNHR